MGNLIAFKTLKSNTFFFTKFHQPSAKLFIFLFGQHFLHRRKAAAQRLLGPAVEEGTLESCGPIVAQPVPAVSDFHGDTLPVVICCRCC